MGLLQAGQRAGVPQAVAPQLAPSGNPAFAQIERMMAAKGMAGNPSDPFTFLHALLSMDQRQFRQMLELLGGGQGGGMGGMY
jgi:hypothetical protein